MNLRCTGEFSFDTTIILDPDSGMAVFSRFPTFRNRGDRPTMESDVESDLYEGQTFDSAFLITPTNTPLIIQLDMQYTPSPLILEWNTKTDERRPIGACVVQE